MSPDAAVFVTCQTVNYESGDKFVCFEKESKSIFVVFSYSMHHLLNFTQLCLLKKLSVYTSIITRNGRR